MAAAGFGPRQMVVASARALEEPVAFDVPFDDRQQLLEADAGQEDDDIDLAGEQLMGELDGRPTRVSRIDGLTCGTPPNFSINRAMASNAATCRWPKGHVLIFAHGPHATLAATRQTKVSRDTTRCWNRLLRWAVSSSRRFPSSRRFRHVGPRVRSDSGGVRPRRRRRRSYLPGRPVADRRSTTNYSNR